MRLDGAVVDRDTRDAGIQPDGEARAERAQPALRRIHHERPLLPAGRADQDFARDQPQAPQRRAEVRVEGACRSQPDPCAIGQQDLPDFAGGSAMVGHAGQDQAGQRRVAPGHPARQAGAGHQRQTEDNTAPGCIGGGGTIGADRAMGIGRRLDGPEQLADALDLGPGRAMRLGAITPAPPRLAVGGGGLFRLQQREPLRGLLQDRVLPVPPLRRHAHRRQSVFRQCSMACAMYLRTMRVLTPSCAATSVSLMPQPEAMTKA